MHVVSSRITTPFEELSASIGYVSYPLLTLTPLYSPCGFPVRLACLNPAASVRSEPGSNSSKENRSWFKNGIPNSSEANPTRLGHSLATSISPKTDLRVPIPLLDRTCLPTLASGRFSSPPQLLSCQSSAGFHRGSRVFLRAFFGTLRHRREAQYVGLAPTVKFIFSHLRF